VRPDAIITGYRINIPESHNRHPHAGSADVLFEFVMNDRHRESPAGTYLAATDYDSARTWTTAA
jgi:hypothetical protein